MQCTFPDLASPTWNQFCVLSALLTCVVSHTLWLPCGYCYRASLCIIVVTVFVRHYAPTSTHTRAHTLTSEVVWVPLAKYASHLCLLGVTACHCVSLRVTACHCVLRVIACHCVLRVIALVGPTRQGRKSFPFVGCQCMSLDVIERLRPGLTKDSVLASPKTPSWTHPRLRPGLTKDSVLDSPKTPSCTHQRLCWWASARTRWIPVRARWMPLDVGGCH